jgi:hypothetical protein
MVCFVLILGLFGHPYLVCAVALGVVHVTPSTPVILSTCRSRRMSLGSSGGGTLRMSTSSKRLEAGTI